MDKEIVGGLFQQYGNDVYRLACSYLGNTAEAEDICQNVFLKLLEKPQTILPGKEKAFLLTCTANACKNQLRSFWRKKVEPLDDNIPFAQEEDRELWQIVCSLPPKYRAVVHLFYYEGYDQQQIAQLLNISRTAVQTRLYRARAILSKELIEK